MPTELKDLAGEHVEGLYDGDPTYEWERLDRHRTEFAVSLRALRQHKRQEALLTLRWL